MFDQLLNASSIVLGVDAYFEDFERHAVKGVDGWKLEVAQTFTESGNSSWEASLRGDWTRSLALLEERRPQVAELVQSPPFPFHRVRVVQRPLTGYMHWELRSLVIRAEYGERIRVLDVTDSEEAAEWPELVVIGEDVLYIVQYSDGSLAGAHKITSNDIVQLARSNIQSLHANSQPINAFAKGCPELLTIPKDVFVPS